MIAPALAALVGAFSSSPARAAIEVAPDRGVDVSLILVIVMAVLFACGVYAMLERSLTRVLIGFLLLGNAANLMLLIIVGPPGYAPFFGGDVSADEMSDPLPQALTLTAIVITFGISAFFLALIYRSWQLAQADTVEDDEADIEVRERTVEAEEELDDESDQDDSEEPTDFVGVETAPITVLHHRDVPAINDGAGINRPRSAGSAPADRPPRPAREESSGSTDRSTPNEPDTSGEPRA